MNCPALECTVHSCPLKKRPRLQSLPTVRHAPVPLVTVRITIDWIERLPRLLKIDCQCIYSWRPRHFHLPVRPSCVAPKTDPITRDIASSSPTVPAPTSTSYVTHVPVMPAPAVPGAPVTVLTTPTPTPTVPVPTFEVGDEREKRLEVGRERLAAHRKKRDKKAASIGHKTTPQVPSPAALPQVPSPAALPQVPSPAALPQVPSPAALPQVTSPATLPRCHAVPELPIAPYVDELCSPCHFTVHRTGYGMKFPFNLYIADPQEEVNDTWTDLRIINIEKSCARVRDHDQLISVQGPGEKIKVGACSYKEVIQHLSGLNGYIDIYFKRARACTSSTYRPPRIYGVA